MTDAQIEVELREASERLAELDERAHRLWERIRISPTTRGQQQYPGA